MLQFVLASFRQTGTGRLENGNGVLLPPTVKRDFTSYLCPTCHADVSLEASHCGHCGQLRPKSAMVERSRFLDLLFYFFRNDYQQQHVEVELDTLRRLKGELLAPNKYEGEEDEMSTTDHREVFEDEDQQVSEDNNSHDNAIEVAFDEVTNSVHVAGRRTLGLLSGLRKDRNSTCAPDEYDDEVERLEVSALRPNSSSALRVDASASAVVARVSPPASEHHENKLEHNESSAVARHVLPGRYQNTDNRGSKACKAVSQPDVPFMDSSNTQKHKVQGLHVNGEPDLVTPTKSDVATVPANNFLQSPTAMSQYSSLHTKGKSNFKRSAPIPVEKFASCPGTEPYQPKDAPYSTVNYPMEQKEESSGVAFMPVDVSSSAADLDDTSEEEEEETQSWQEQSERAFNSRLRELKNHLQPGIHDDTALYLERGPTDGSRATRSHFKWEKLDVCRRSWTDPAVLTAEFPVLFPRAGYLEPRLVGVAAQLRLDFIKLCANHSSTAAAAAVAASCQHISTADEIKPGYMKGHLEEPFVSNVFAFTIPPCLLIKRRADQKAIAFITTHQPSQCDTHYDRDTSLLLMLAGKKEVFLAPPRQRWQDEVIHNNSTIFESVDPFFDFNRGTLGSEWKKIVMQQGDALLIPRKWLHSIHSHPGTVAVSFQVEIAPVPFDVPSYFNIPSVDEIIKAALLANEPIEIKETLQYNISSDQVKSPSQASSEDEEEESAQEGGDVEGGGGESDAGRIDEASVTHEIISVTTTVDSSKNSKKRKSEAPMPLAQKRRLALLQRPELAPVRKGTKGGRRIRYECDWCDCAGFSKHGEMWFLRLVNEEDMDEKVLPMVTDRPVKFLCLSCVPRMGSSVITPDVILEYPEELAAAEKYNFYLGTKVDYQVWSGESKKEQFL